MLQVLLASIDLALRNVLKNLSSIEALYDVGVTAGPGSRFFSSMCFSYSFRFFRNKMQALISTTSSWGASREVTIVCLIFEAPALPVTDSMAKYLFEIAILQTLQIVARTL